ncbi:plasma-membrane proton-efflux P-type ATPase [Halothiobacillus sp. DCM-1]|uniref:plasma-membrane proton-efflux P-type ATPase n=1 Tax=Halothiobacillus sp. DCM-1 TaxID=3112558 RepID=UPI003249BC81
MSPSNDSPDLPVSPVRMAQEAGLSSAEAQERLQRFGRNAIPEQTIRPIKAYLQKFWSPVPWMLEGVVVLELVLHHWTEAVIIALLLVFNATLAFLNEQRAQTALALLRQQLQINARVLRDGAWRTIPAAEVVPGDWVHVRAGDLTPADFRVLDGQIAVDQSSLTGESLPVTLKVGETGYASCTVRQGEATGEVIATGLKTAFGRTAELVQAAAAPSHMQQIILRIVRYLVVFDSFLSLIVFVYALATGMPLLDTLSFVLILLVASVPVALPATYALATALAAQELSKQGVLVTRLAAVEDAAAMTTLVSDKTGTLTQNSLSLSQLMPAPGVDAAQVLLAAAMASDDATQDPIDLAFLAAFHEDSAAQTLAQQFGNLSAQRVEFSPFDPATRRSEGRYRTPEGSPLRFVKGASNVMAAVGAPPPSDWLTTTEAALAATGARVLAVAADTGSGMIFLGLAALADPPRKDAASLIEALRQLGVRVRMATGDAVDTARAISRTLGLGERICDREAIVGLSNPSASADGAAEGKAVPRAASQINACDGFARVLPEDKFHLVTALQKQNEIIGMTGDGVNDAPALRQAELGVAVSSATDVAKAAAGVVLVQPGLAGVLDVVRIGRQVHRRMLTYTLNKIVKVIEIVVFLTLGVIITHDFVISPALIVLLMFTNDFITMTIASDRVEPAKMPQHWSVRRLMAAASLFGAISLLFSFSLYTGVRLNMPLSPEQLQTFLFLILVFTNQASVYALRSDGALWRVKPSRLLVMATLGDVLVVSLLATWGVFMAALPLSLVMAVILLSIAFAFMLGWAKEFIFPRFGLSGSA